jgi:hypothetical protein
MKVSAWLNSSKSSNSKYWANVVGLYNRNTPKDRKQARVQLKHHWQKINKKVAHFYDCWCKVEAKYSSIQSEKMQLMDKTWAMYNEEAREMYLEERNIISPSTIFGKLFGTNPSGKDTSLLYTPRKLSCLNLGTAHHPPKIPKMHLK